ncbi:MAG: porin, partial [Thiobacillus sp.]
MNKKLIALALASAFAAPMAMAADGVTLYGQMGVSVDSVDGDNAVGSLIGGERRTRVSSNNSRIGFKGTEDLNSDMSAIWQIEYAVQMDQQGYSQPQGSNDSQGAVSLRNTFVGLSSKRMGALTLGTQESPLKTSTAPLAVFSDTLADYRSVFTKQSNRFDNSVLYTSPSLGGLVIRAMYGARNEAGNDNQSDPSIWGASV